MKLKEAAPRAGFFEEESLRAVRDRLPPDLRAIAEVYYVTGWRHDELTTRQWRHVDFRSGTLRLDPGETKNGRGRVFPMTPRLRSVLKAQERKTKALSKGLGKIIPWVFWRHRGPGIREDGQRCKTFYKAWRRACREAGVPGRLVHDFRRTSVRNLSRAGVHEKAAMEMVGMRTRVIFDRYNIVDEEMLREAAAKLDRYERGRGR